MAADDLQAPAAPKGDAQEDAPRDDGEDDDDEERLALARRLFALRRPAAARAACLSLLAASRRPPPAPAARNTALLLLLRIARDAGAWHDEWRRACDIAGGIPALSEEILCLGALELVKAGQLSSARNTIELWLASQPDSYFECAAAAAAADVDAADTAAADSRTFSNQGYSHIVELYMLALAGLGDFDAGAEFLARNVTLGTKQRLMLVSRLEELRQQAVDAVARSAISSTSSGSNTQKTSNGRLDRQPTDPSASTKLDPGLNSDAGLSHDASVHSGTPSPAIAPEPQTALTTTNAHSNTRTSTSTTTDLVDLIRKSTRSLSTANRRVLLRVYQLYQSSILHRTDANTAIDPATSFIVLALVTFLLMAYSVLKYRFGSAGGGVLRILGIVRDRLLATARMGMITSNSI